jgi:hypothetical protein
MAHYLGEAHATLTDEHDFVDTADMVNAAAIGYFPRPAKRHHQRRRAEDPPGGSRDGDQPAPGGPHVDGAVARSPITGLLVTAELVLARSQTRGAAGAVVDVKREILQLCHDSLAPYKIPATIRLFCARDCCRQAGLSCVRGAAVQGDR